MQTQNVVTDKEREIRKRDLEDKDRKNASERRQEQKNQNFTQVYPLGWKRLRELFRKNPGAAELYSMLAENIDGSCGAVVADQTHLASLLGVGRQTISRYVKWLEEQGVLVKIPVAGKVCAYALNPHEVWKGYDNAKPYAAFLTKTLVNKDGDIPAPNHGHVPRNVPSGHGRRHARSRIDSRSPNRRSPPWGHYRFHKELLHHSTLKSPKTLSERHIAIFRPKPT